MNDLTTVTPVISLSVLDWIALVVTIVGGVNWGLVGVAGFDLIAALFGVQTPITRIFYIVVGLMALYAIHLAWRLAGRST
ncbi:MAG TPA: DUF378 domain-containing protein [Candidimonas sp.]|nr:DUF378 domain-containing protein [Candidimonas sp.]